MTKDERIQGLLEANNINVERRRGLARALRVIQKHSNDTIVRNLIDAILLECGPR